MTDFSVSFYVKKKPPKGATFLHYVPTVLCCASDIRLPAVFLRRIPAKQNIEQRRCLTKVQSAQSLPPYIRSFSLFFIITI